eukprot:26203-Eustigmatos_ZCMA.PRE.1
MHRVQVYVQDLGVEAVHVRGHAGHDVPRYRPVHCPRMVQRQGLALRVRHAPLTVSGPGLLMTHG